MLDEGGGDTSTSQGTPEIASGHQKPEETGTHSPSASEGTMLADTLVLNF